MNTTLLQKLLLLLSMVPWARGGQTQQKDQKGAVEPTSSDCEPTKAKRKRLGEATSREKERRNKSNNQHSNCTNDEVDKSTPLPSVSPSASPSEFPTPYVSVSPTEFECTLIRFTATSNSSGELGYLVVDSQRLDQPEGVKKALPASSFADYYFADPLGTAIITPDNVYQNDPELPSFQDDSGMTIFRFLDYLDTWTVTAGFGASIVAMNGDMLWISNYRIAVGNHDYFDATWSTSCDK